jgi:ectoine hydroxylase-related dioxygenase (phytanoyl-CoA dioxygenase family)
MASKSPFLPAVAHCLMTFHYTRTLGNRSPHPYQTILCYSRSSIRAISSSGKDELFAGRRHSGKGNLVIKPILISRKERLLGDISISNLQISLKEFHRNGLVIVENAVNEGPLNHIHERMLQDVPKNLALPNVHFNHGKAHKNVSQNLPLEKEYLHKEVWANRFAVTIMEHIIGPRPQLSFAKSNIALPGGQGRQAVHSDYYCEHLDFPVFIEVCIFLDDVSSVNGSTELWLGTHEGYNKGDHAFVDMGWIKREVFSERAKICPPFQPIIKKGSICIRDIRLWHAGMPNFSSVPRIMLGFLYSPRWFASRMRLRFPRDARATINSWDHIDCMSVADFTDLSFNYLHLCQELNLTHRDYEDDSKYIPRHGSTAATPEHYWSPENECDDPNSIISTKSSQSIRN